MNIFTVLELEYLRSLQVARLATVGADGYPHVVPIGFRLSDDDAVIEIGGWGFARSKKFRDLQVNPQVAIVIDDVGGESGKEPRGVEVRGRAVIHDRGGDRFGPGRDPQWVSITPERVSTWGIVKSAFQPGGHTSRAVGGTR